MADPTPKPHQAKRIHPKCVRCHQPITTPHCQSRACPWCSVCAQDG